MVTCCYWAPRFVLFPPSVVCSFFSLDEGFLTSYCTAHSSFGTSRKSYLFFFFLNVSQNLKQPTLLRFPLYSRLQDYQFCPHISRKQPRSISMPPLLLPLFLYWILYPRGWTALKNCSIANCVNSAHDADMCSLSQILFCTSDKCSIM